MIEIYSSKLNSAPDETHAISGPIAIEKWLCSQAPSFRPEKSPPVSVTVNGCPVDPDMWDEFTIHPGDDVAVCVEPKNDTFSLFFNPIAHSKIGLLKYMMPKIPGTGAGTPKGKELQGATVKSNQAKINSIIREVAGTYKVYPDYLLPAHKYFVDKKYEWSEMLTCIGKGEYEIPASSVLVGSTRMASFGSDAEYQIYGPGADLSGDSAAIWWHNVPEVGVTSTGKAGLELSAEYAGIATATASSYQFSGFNISVPAGAGFFPAGWAVGMVALVYQKLTYEVVEGWSDRDIITGDFTSLEPFEGMKVGIVGENAGNYTIFDYTSDSDGERVTLSYDGGSQVNGLLTGTRRMSIAYRGSRYEITHVYTDGGGNITSIDVDRLTDEGDVDNTWGGFGFAITNDASIQLDGSGIEGGWVGPFVACPDGEVTNMLEYDLMFPQGIGGVNEGGDVDYMSVTVEVQWRDAEIAGAWTSILKTYTDASLDQMGFTETLNLPGYIRPEVRIRRIGAKSTKLSENDVVQWYALKAKLAAPASYAGVTTMTVKLRGGDRISAQSDQMISVQATRKIPTRSAGAWTAPAVTRNPVDWAVYVLKNMGYTDADLDMASMDSLRALLATRGDTYDFAIESQGTVKSELAACLRAGFAEFTLDRGLIKPVRDEIRTVYEHMYTPQNMTEPLSRQFLTLRPDDFDGVDVEYVSSTTWAKETVECRLPGDLGVKVEKISLEGVTDATRAWRIGMRQRRSHRYRRWAYSFATELDALNSRYLSFCALGDDVPGYSQSAILLECVVGATVLLKSSEPLRWTEGESHVVGIRRQNGTLSGPYAATRISDTLLEIPRIDFEPDTPWQTEPPHLIFGTLARWSYPVLITSISPSADNQVSVEAMNYDARVYADDDNSPT